MSEFTLLALIEKDGEVKEHTVGQPQDTSEVLVQKMNQLTREGGRLLCFETVRTDILQQAQLESIVEGMPSLVAMVYSEDLRAAS